MDRARHFFFAGAGLALHEHGRGGRGDALEAIDDVEKLRVCGDDGSVHVELDDGLRFADGFDLAVAVGPGQFLLGDIGCKFDDLERLAGLVEDRIVSQKFRYSALSRWAGSTNML